MSRQVEMFLLDDHLDYLESLIKKIRGSRCFFDASELAGSAVRTMDLIQDPTGESNRWYRITKMGVELATDWCTPGTGGCGKNRVDHVMGRLCTERT